MSGQYQWRNVWREHARIHFDFLPTLYICGIRVKDSNRTNKYIFVRLRKVHLRHELALRVRAVIQPPPRIQR